MRRVLVIRSVSFQQLDASLEAVRARFPGAALDLLTHEHGRQLAASYASLATVHVYPERGSFRKGGWVPGPGLRWDDVVVPVANVSGAGFANVFELARAIGGGAVHRCNVAGAIVELSPRDLDTLLRREGFTRIAASLAGPVLGLAVAACFGAAAGVARLARSGAHPR